MVNNRYFCRGKNSHTRPQLRRSFNDYNANIRIHFRQTSMWRLQFVTLDSIWERDFEIVICLAVFGESNLSFARGESHYFLVALFHCLYTVLHTMYLSCMSPCEECWCKTWPAMPIQRKWLSSNCRFEELVCCRLFLDMSFGSSQDQLCCVVFRRLPRSTDWQTVSTNFRVEASAKTEQSHTFEVRYWLIVTWTRSAILNLHVARRRTTTKKNPYISIVGHPDVGFGSSFLWFQYFALDRCMAI
jgi:hypothetical protein